MGPNVSTDRGHSSHDDQPDEEETIHVGVDGFFDLTKELKFPANTLGNTLHLVVQGWGNENAEILLVCPGEPLQDAPFDEQVHADGHLEFRVKIPETYPGHVLGLLPLLQAFFLQENLLGITRTHIGWEAVDKHLNNLRKGKIRRSPWKDLIVEVGFKGSCMKRSSTSDCIDFKFVFENQEPVIVVVNKKHHEYRKRVGSNPETFFRLFSLPLRIWLRILFHRKKEVQAANVDDSSPRAEEEAVIEADSLNNKWWWPFSSGREEVNLQKLPASHSEEPSPPDLAVAATTCSHTLDHNHHLFSPTDNSLKQTESKKESASSRRKKRKHTAQRHLLTTDISFHTTHASSPSPSAALIAPSSFNPGSLHPLSHPDQAASGAALSGALSSLSSDHQELSGRTSLPSSPSSTSFNTPLSHISPAATEYHTPVGDRSKMASSRASSPPASFHSEQGSQRQSPSPQTHPIDLLTGSNASLADTRKDLPYLLREEDTTSTGDNKDRDMSDEVFQPTGPSFILQSTPPPHKNQELHQSPCDLLTSPSLSHRPRSSNSSNHDASYTIASETGTSQEQEQPAKLETRARPISFIQARTQARLDAHPEIASSLRPNKASGQGSSAGQSSNTTGNQSTDTSIMPTKKQRDNRRIKRRKQTVKRRRAAELDQRVDASADDIQTLAARDEAMSETSEMHAKLNENHSSQKSSTEQNPSVEHSQYPEPASPAKTATLASEDVHQGHDITSRDENESRPINEVNQQTETHPQSLQSQHCDVPAVEIHPAGTVNDITTSIDDSNHQATEHLHEQRSYIELAAADTSHQNVSTDSVPELSSDISLFVSVNHVPHSQSPYSLKSEDTPITEAAPPEQQPADAEPESSCTVDSVIVHTPLIEPSHASSSVNPDIQSRNRVNDDVQQNSPSGRHGVRGGISPRASRRGRPPRRGRHTRASFRDRKIETTTQRVHNNSSSAEGVRAAVTNAELQGRQVRQLPAPDSRISPAVEHRDEQQQQPESQRTSTTVLTGTNHAAATRSHNSGQVAESSIGRVPIQHGTLSTEHGSPGATVVPAADSLSSQNRHFHHHQRQQQRQYTHPNPAPSSRRRGNSKSNNNTRGRFSSGRRGAANSARTPLRGRAAPFNPEAQEFHQRRPSVATTTTTATATDDSLISAGTSGDHVWAPRPTPLYLSSPHLSYGRAAVLAPTVADTPTAMMASSASSVIIPVRSDGRGPTFPSNKTYNLNDRRAYVPAFGPALPPAADDPSISGRYERTEYGTRPWTAPTSGGWWWNLDSEGFPCAKHDCQRRCNLWDGVSTICPKCGPYSKVRYCSRDHLLGDIAQHWPWCGTQQAFEQPCKDSTVPRALRQGPPMLPSKHRWDSPERHRQAVHFNMNQRRGDYFIFADWPEYVAAGWPEDLASIRCSSEILCVVKFEDPTEKDRFRRVLGACLFAGIEHVKMVEYLFRLVRDHLRTEGVWTSQIDAALRYQLHIEMQVHIHPLAVGQRHACETEWDGRHPRHCADEVCRAERPALLADVEMGRGYRRLVEVMESAYWLLRAARTTHPDVRQVSPRVRGEGFEDVVEEDRRLFWRGEGWDGLDTGEMEVEGVNL